MSHLIEILLPVTSSRRSRVNLDAVRDELTGKYGGATLHLEAPAEGIWSDGGDFERDRIVVVEVMIDDLDRAWWNKYRQELEERFRQEEIVMRATVIEDSRGRPSSEPSRTEQVTVPEGLENPMRTDKETLQIVEEELIVEKTSVLDGRVAISTRTNVINELADFELGSTNVSVERVAVGTVVHVAPQVRIEGDVTIIPVLEERLVVEKRLVLVEEVWITTTKILRTERVAAELRKQSAVIERTDEHENNEENSHG